MLLPAIVATLVAFLIVGYALLYWPHLPADFTVDQKARSPRIIEALYFSGITFTILGYGDIAPHSTPMRLLALSEALTGFGFISLAVTYLVSLTAALERKRAVALSFYHQARQGADVAGLFIQHFVNGRFIGLETIFAGAARSLRTGKLKKRIHCSGSREDESAVIFNEESLTFSNIASVRHKNFLSFFLIGAGMVAHPVAE